MAQSVRLNIHSQHRQQPDDDGDNPDEAAPRHIKVLMDRRSLPPLASRTTVLRYRSLSTVGHRLQSPGVAHKES